MVEDPRWIEHRDAYAAVSKGLSAPDGAHERYRQAQLPYVELLAEHCDPHMRKPMMLSLFEHGLALGIIGVGFKATEEELDYVRDRPPVVEEAVDEIERLQRMPYPQYLKTPHWQKVRKDALERAGHRCTLCNTTERLEVHHRSYKRKGCEPPADVVVLCPSCHRRHHGTLREVA